jgi:hypothetical protein
MTKNAKPASATIPNVVVWDDGAGDQFVFGGPASSGMNFLMTGGNNGLLHTYFPSKKTYYVLFQGLDPFLEAYDNGTAGGGYLNLGNQVLNSMNLAFYADQKIDFWFNGENSTIETGIAATIKGDGFMYDGNGVKMLDLVNHYAFDKNGVKILDVQQPAIANATGAGDVVAQLNLLLAACRAHGLIQP